MLKRAVCTLFESLFWLIVIHVAQKTPSNVFHSQWKLSKQRMKVIVLWCFMALYGFCLSMFFWKASNQHLRASHSCSLSQIQSFQLLGQVRLSVFLKGALLDSDSHLFEPHMSHIAWRPRRALSHSIFRRRINAEPTMSIFQSWKFNNITGYTESIISHHSKQPWLGLLRWLYHIIGFTYY